VKRLACSRSRRQCPDPLISEPFTLNLPLDSLTPTSASREPEPLESEGATCGLAAASLCWETQRGDCRLTLCSRQPALPAGTLVQAPTLTSKPVAVSGGREPSSSPAPPPQPEAADDQDRKDEASAAGSSSDWSAASIAGIAAASLGAMVLGVGLVLAERYRSSRHPQDVEAGRARLTLSPASSWKTITSWDSKLSLMQSSKSKKERTPTNGAVVWKRDDCEGNNEPVSGRGHPS